MALTLSLNGQSAIVTGGASGIGRATALLLAQAGASVTVFDIDDILADTLDDKSIKVQHCDMSKSLDIDRAFDEFLKREKKIDILVNNVGIWVPGGDILEMSDDVIANMEAVNVDGPRHLTRLAMNDMKVRDAGGAVIFVSSTQAHVVDGTPTIYNVQKNTILA